MKIANYRTTLWRLREIIREYRPLKVKSELNVELSIKEKCRMRQLEKRIMLFEYALPGSPKMDISPEIAARAISNKLPETFAAIRRKQERRRNVRLILLLILCAFICSGARAQVQKDKAWHLCAGTVISSAATGLTYKWTGRRDVSLLAGFTAGTLAGIAKEVYDKKTGNGTPSQADALWTVAGAAIGSFGVTVCIKDYKRPEGAKL